MRSARCGPARGTATTRSGKDLLGRLRRDRIEMRDVDDCRDSCHRERALTDGVCGATVLATVVVVVRGSMDLDDRGLVRTEGQLQAVGLRGRQHETDRQKCARYQ